MAIPVGERNIIEAAFRESLRDEHGNYTPDECDPEVFKHSMTRLFNENADMKSAILAQDTPTAEAILEARARQRRTDFFREKEQEESRAIKTGRQSEMFALPTGRWVKIEGGRKRRLGACNDDQVMSYAKTLRSEQKERDKQKPFVMVMGDIAKEFTRWAAEERAAGRTDVSLHAYLDFLEAASPRSSRSARHPIPPIHESPAPAE